MAGFRPRFFLPADELPKGADGALGADARAPEPGQEVALSPEDSHHALDVLRLKKGDVCEVVVGAAVYAATIRSTASPVSVTLGARLEGAEAGGSYRIPVGLVQAWIRPVLIDEVIERGTEVGASFFVVVQAAGSPRRPELATGDRLARWSRIAREAAKQSKQVAVPTLAVASSLDQVFDRPELARAVSLALEPRAPLTLVEAIGRPAAPPARIALWIGPEGGWSAEELERFSGWDLQAARLGRGVLRTETAGPVAVAAARLVLGDW